MLAVTPARYRDCPNSEFERPAKRETEALWQCGRRPSAGKGKKYMNLVPGLACSGVALLVSARFAREIKCKASTIVPGTGQGHG